MTKNYRNTSSPPFPKNKPENKIKSKLNSYDVIPIFNQPIIFAAVWSVSNSEYTVVKSGRAAGGLVVDSLLVQLEWPMTCVNGDRDGSNGGDSLLEFVLVFVGDVHEAGIGGPNVVSLELAEAVLIKKLKKIFVWLNNSTVNKRIISTDEIRYIEHK